MLLNEMMKIEREQYLPADSHERAQERRGHDNGFRSKVLATRVGKLTLAIPQARGLAEGSELFYPKALDRALVAAVSESYLLGVSTRRMLKITEELCGFQVSSSQVSRITSELDEHFGAWRNRPLGVCP
ncbi:MAG: transposase [Planctomycetes bacterium]|nr:transposase [Planctomycetota bacterium]